MIKHIYHDIYLSDPIKYMELWKYKNGSVDIHIIYTDDSYLSSSVYSKFTDLSYGENEVILKNISMLNVGLFIDNILVHSLRFYDEKIGALPGITQTGKYEAAKIILLIYEFVSGKKLMTKHDIFKLLLFSDFERAMAYLDRHINLLMLFIDIVYYQQNDVRYFEIIHKKINDVITDANFLSEFTDEEIKKIYYTLALIIYKPNMSDEENIAVLEYLFKADDYTDAKDLKKRISFGIMGYGLGESPKIEINLDVPTLFFLMKTHKK